VTFNALTQGILERFPALGPIARDRLLPDAGVGEGPFSGIHAARKQPLNR